MKKILLFIAIIVLIGISVKTIFLDEFNQDGIYLKLSIDEKLSIKQRLNSFAIKIQSQLDREEILYDDIKIEQNKLIFEYLDGDDNLKIDKILNNYKSIVNIEKNEFIYTLSFLSRYVQDEEQKLLKNTKKVLENRLEEAGLYNRLFDIFLSEKATIKISENKFIEITIPKLCNKCSAERVKQMLGAVGYFSIMPLNDNDEIQKSSIPIIDSSFLKKALLVFKDDKAELNIQLDTNGAKILADYTARNILKKIAIVIDDKIYATPRIMDNIRNDSFVVELEGLKSKDIYDLVLVLNNRVLSSKIRFDMVKKRSKNSLW